MLRRRIAESKLALIMKVKIAQKRKIAEIKFAKSMRNEIEERRKRAQERALNSKFKVQRPEKKYKSLLLEETSDHKAKSRISKFEEKPAYQVSALLNMFRFLLLMIQL